MVRGLSVLLVGVVGLLLIRCKLLPDLLSVGIGPLLVGLVAVGIFDACTDSRFSQRCQAVVERNKASVITLGGLMTTVVGIGISVTASVAASNTFTGKGGMGFVEGGFLTPMAWIFIAVSTGVTVSVAPLVADMLPRKWGYPQRILAGVAILGVISLPAIMLVAVQHLAELSLGPLFPVEAQAVDSSR